MLDNFANIQSERRQFEMQQKLRLRLDSFISAAIGSGADPEEIYPAVLSWKGAIAARQRWLALLARFCRAIPRSNDLIVSSRLNLCALASAYSAVVPPNQRQTQHDVIVHLNQEVETLEQQLAQASQEFRGVREASLFGERPPARIVKRHGTGRLH